MKEGKDIGVMEHDGKEDGLGLVNTETLDKRKEERCSSGDWTREGMAD